MHLDLTAIRERWAPFADALHLGSSMGGGDRLFCGTREIARSQDSAYDLQFWDEAAEAAVCAAPVDIAALIAEVEHLRATSALVSSRAPEWAMNLASAHLSRETDGSHYGNVVDLAKLLDSVRTSDAPTEVVRLRAAIESALHEVTDGPGAITSRVACRVAAGILQDALALPADVAYPVVEVANG